MKTCLACNEDKPLSAFPRDITRPSKIYVYCRQCCAIRYQKSRRTDPIRWAKKLAVARSRHKANPAAAMYWDAKKRAKKKGLPFTITIADIVIPEVCPVFNVKLEVCSKGHRWSPSLDAKIPVLGYVPENIQVMSRFANTMKSDATADLLLDFADWANRTQVRSFKSNITTADIINLAFRKISG
jgi:hypothetical protein